MPPQNPSELARLTEELAELFEDLKENTKYYSKAKKEQLLREIRWIEGVLGKDSKHYNG